MSDSELTDERIERDGLTLRFYYDECPEHANPRDCDNLGTMVCWHPDYILGDYQLRENNGAVEHEFEHGWGRDGLGFSSLEVLERYLRVACDAIVTVPLYLYDHSGISMSAGSPNLFDNPTIRRDHHGNGLGWDTTACGYIYTTAARCRELCGEGENGTLYAPSDWSGSKLAWIGAQLQDEVNTYNQFLTGDVYGYAIEDSNGETVDSCWGFFGFECVKEEAVAALDSAVADSLDRWERKVRGWASARCAITTT